MGTFALTVRDHIMIAHSLKGAAFGPAQRIHGATFVVDLELRRADLDPFGVVADIGRLSALLKDVLAPINYRNLDEVPELAGCNTTTEVLARWIGESARERILAGALGDCTGLGGIKVTLHESHLAWASYETELMPA